MRLGTLTEIKPALFHQICSEAWDEDAELDFKRDLFSPKDEAAKNDFLKDVCGFANANGGEIIFGINEKNGSADTPTPISQQEYPSDATERRLLQLIHSRIEPRLNVDIESVSESDKYYLVVRIHPSFQKPHLYKVNSYSGWVKRVNTQAVEMNYQQIRDEFEKNSLLYESAKSFRQDRIDSLLSGKHAIRLKPGPKCLINLIPLVSMSGGVNINVANHYAAYQKFTFGSWQSIDRALNLDGLLISPGDSAIEQRYIQVFRNCALEAAMHVGCGNSDVHGITVANFVRFGLIKFLEITKEWNIPGPAIIGVSLMNVKGSEFSCRPKHDPYTYPRKADREHLVLPVHWVEDISKIKSGDELARPQLDMLWQCFDYERCFDYDEDGNWGAQSG